MKKRINFTPQVLRYLASISKEANKRIANALKKLSAQGYLRAPDAEKVEGQDGLFEVRVKDSNGQYRVFYFYYEEDAIWMLSGFTKKTQKTPPAEIRKALAIKKEIENEN